ncbi:MAG TPA: CSLREA domain-containing protein, partial [Tepidiformaceae bacterium]|nr:CSLREA domain-containing protein [Tepidiformaceae bacterium]
MRRGVFIVGLLLSAAIWGGAPPAAAAQGASITVDSSADTVAVDGECTLREAIINAEDDAPTNQDCESGAGADVVLIEVDGPIHLQQPLPSVTTILRVEASGNATISGDSNDDGTPDVQILTLVAGSELTLRYLTLARGGGQLGGAINAGGGTLIAHGVTFRENRAADDQSGGAGGAIFADGGVVSLSGVLLVDNVATVGGAVNVSGGELAIFGSTFDGNAADFGAAFAAVDATVFLADTTITGGRSTGGTVELTNGSADFNNVTLLGNSSQERGTLVLGTSSAANSIARLSLRHVLGDRNTHAGNTSGFGVDLEIDTFEATQASVSAANSLIGTCRARARGSVMVTGSHNLSLVG